MGSARLTPEGARGKGNTPYPLIVGKGRRRGAERLARSTQQKKTARGPPSRFETRRPRLRSSATVLFFIFPI